MPRLPRPDYEHTYHHVVVRGVDGLPIFDTIRKKEKYIKILVEALQSHDLSVYAVGFVNNHVHMFIRRNHQSMGVFYRRVNGSYGSWYNCTFKRTGALYDGRYYSSLVDSNNYFHAVWRYVHFQGVKAGFYESVREDPWSSAGLYLGLKSKFSWIHWKEAMEELEVEVSGQIKKILEYEGEEKKWYGKEKFPHKLYRGQKFLAGKAFVEQYRGCRINPRDRAGGSFVEEQGFRRKAHTEYASRTFNTEIRRMSLRPEGFERDSSICFVAEPAT
jgi:REP element-mobilizing transposase RayT